MAKPREAVVLSWLQRHECGLDPPDFHQSRRDAESAKAFAGLTLQAG
jgi:hypothetical protein